MYIELVSASYIKGNNKLNSLYVCFNIFYIPYIKLKGKKSPNTPPLKSTIRDSQPDDLFL